MTFYTVNNFWEVLLEPFFFLEVVGVSADASNFNCKGRLGINLQELMAYV